MSLIACAFSFSVVYAQGVISRKKQSTTTIRSKVNNKTQGVKSVSNVSNPDGYINVHGYVDLGLSVKWATCNIGASSSERYGEYYAWGETSPKLEYNVDNYKYYEGNYIYTNIGNDIKGSQYDTARSNWGKHGECLLKPNAKNL